MNILDRFEQRVEQVMEGGIGRLFRSPVQPAEIGRKLERAMSEQAVVSVRGKLVPNQFTVRLHPRDLAPFAAYQFALERQLESWLDDVVGRRDYIVVARIEVELRASDAVAQRTIAVSAAITDRERAADVQRPGWASPTALAAAGDRPQRPRLRFLNGPQRRLESVISRPQTTIGRDPTNDVVLDVGVVSRHHARLDLVNGELRVVDLGSTNGTRVNGQPIRASLLRPGDEVSFGTIRAQVVGDA